MVGSSYRGPKHNTDSPYNIWIHNQPIDQYNTGRQRGIEAREAGNMGTPRGAGGKGGGGGGLGTRCLHKRAFDHQFLNAHNMVPSRL
jgi:hypothetical protein